MINVNEVLKNAWIDSQLSSCLNKAHTFSPEFETKMRRLIKSQKGFLKLVNTTSKKVACILLSALLVTITTVCSVEALREPFIEAVQSFYVNIKNRLTGTRADNIAQHFTDNITQIVATNCITSVPKEYIIDDPKKLADFTALLTETDWATPENQFEVAKDYMTYRFEFKSEDKTVVTLEVYNSSPGNSGTVEIIANGKSSVYLISERTYREILAFTTQTYYLHKSDLEPPDESVCLKWHSEALSGLNEMEKEEFCETFKWLHIHIEDFLLGNVSSLKDPDSVYWEIFDLGRDEVFVDPFTGTEWIDNSYHILLDCFDQLLSIVVDQEMKNTVERMKIDFCKAIDNHDIGSVFSVHEMIHDYDYYVVNYPIHYSLAPPDWGGIHKYFGHLE